MTEDAATQRLLDAWRGEVQARAQYEILAQRMGDPRRADIIRQIAEPEGHHRERVEKRLQELGVRIPSPESARLSALQRLQARLAPISVVISRMEDAEQSEIDDRYHRPTGDPVTDEVLSSIRVEEHGHSRSLDELQAAHATEAKPSGVQSHLDRILRRETWHRTGTGWISGAIYGANDGLAAVFGIVAGVSGATGGSSFVLTAGLTGAVASGLSMATGAFLAARSEAEVAAANIERERREVEENPEEEKEELSLFYQLKGIDAETATMLADFLVGAAKSLFTLRTWWSAGLEMTLAGVIVGGITYALGLLIKVGG